MSAVNFDTATPVQNGDGRQFPAARDGSRTQIHLDISRVWLNLQSEYTSAILWNNGYRNHSTKFPLDVCLRHILRYVLTNISRLALQMAAPVQPEADRENNRTQNGLRP